MTGIAVFNAAHVPIKNFTIRKAIPFTRVDVAESLAKRSRRNERADLRHIHKVGGLTSHRASISRGFQSFIQSYQERGSTTVGVHTLELSIVNR